MNPDVTVVVPTRNRAEVLRVTLGSILRQRDVELRVVVVDEASTDETPEMLERLSDPRLEVVRHRRPHGVAAARNTGLGRVRTPWVAFCDDDDLWAPGKLTAQLELLDDDHRWCCGASVLVDEQLRVIDHQRAISGDVLDELLRANTVPGGGSGVVVDADLVREVGGFAEELRNSEDWDLWIRLAEQSPIAGVDRPLVAYRIWPGSKSRDMSRMEAAYEAITARHRELAERRGVTPDPWNHQRYLARQQVRSGRRLAAARGYTRVARNGGDPRQWVRAAAAMVSPGVMDRIGTERAARRVPPCWRHEAETWLAELPHVACLLDSRS
jgi:glycosyltransferase involved in cell wall biosynthesis